MGADWPSSTAPLPMRILLGTPTCPHKVTLSSITQAPDTPTCEANKHIFPTTVSWPTCTWLSILVPRPITVFPETPLSMVQQAPISTSSSMITPPQDIILSYRSE